MKKITIILILLCCFFITSCYEAKPQEEDNHDENNDQNTDLVDMEYLYQNMDLVFDDYKKILAQQHNISSYHHFILDDLPIKSQEELILSYGEGLKSIIAVYDSDQDYYSYVAMEYSTEEQAQKRYDEHHKAIQNFFQYKNVLLYDVYPSYILIDSGYETDRNYVLNKNKDVLLYNNVDSFIHIPEGVKKIAGGAFMNNINIKAVYCNDELESIGIMAFYQNINLLKIDLNDNLTYITKGAFAGCVSLEYVIMPTSVKYISNNVFSHTNVYLNVSEIPIEWGKEFIFLQSKVYVANTWTIGYNGKPEPLE